MHIDFGFMHGTAPGGSFSLEVAPFKVRSDPSSAYQGTHKRALARSPCASWNTRTQTHTLRVLAMFALLTSALHSLARLLPLQMTDDYLDILLAGCGSTEGASPVFAEWFRLCCLGFMALQVGARPRRPFWLS